MAAAAAAAESLAHHDGSDAAEAKPTILADVAVLVGFELQQVLQQDAKTRSAILLGTLPSASGDGQRDPAILTLEKTHFSDDFYASIGDLLQPSSEISARGDKRIKLTTDEGHGATSSIQPGTASTVDDASRTAGPTLRQFSRLVSLGNNDIYTWLLGYLRHSDPPELGPADVKISMICPATATHIAKYSEQEKVVISETPELYRTVTLPWIESQDPGRIAWVGNIIEGRKERENVVHRDEDPATGFVILPDLKWDRHTLPSLYLIAIARDSSIRSLRDLRREHVPLLRKIAAAAEKVAAEQYGLTIPLPTQGGADGGSANSNGRPEHHNPPTAPSAIHTGKLRCFIHYPPSYYHLHVHVLSADYTSHPGAIVGQAHLLEDVIDLLELGVDFTQRTLGFHVGVRSDLYTQALKPALTRHQQA